MTSVNELQGSIARTRPRLLFPTLMLGHMAQGLAFTAFVSSLPQMARDLGSQGELIAQMTMALAALGVMIGALVSGWILEKAGTRVTLLASLLMFGIAGAGGMFLRNPALLLSSRFIVGFTSACMVTTCVWGIAAEYSGTRRARALGISVALSTASSVTGTLLGGYLAQRAGWPLAFIQYPVFALAGLLLAWGGIGQVRPGREIPGATRQPYITGLLPFYLFTVLLFAVMFMGSTQFAFQLEADGITSSATRALIMGAITVVATVFSFCYGSVQQRLGALGAFTVGLASMAGALALIGLGSTMITAVLGAALMGIFVGLCNPYLYHHITEQTDIFSRSRAIGLLGAFSFFGGFLNPLVFANLSRVIGLRNVFLVVALLMAVLALGAAINIIRRQRVTRRIATVQ